MDRFTFIFAINIQLLLNFNVFSLFFDPPFVPNPLLHSLAEITVCAIKFVSVIHSTFMMFCVRCIHHIILLGDRAMGNPSFRLILRIDHLPLVIVCSILW
eukprot:409855_1